MFQAGFAHEREARFFSDIPAGLHLRPGHAVANPPQESRKDWMDMVFKYHSATIRQNEQHAFWQKTNHATELWTPAVVRQKVDYIHDNPVRASFVNESYEWKLSSANPASPITVLDY